MREPLDCVELKVVAGNGNCAFAAFAEAANRFKLAKPGTILDERMFRVKTVKYMKGKGRAKFATFWDGDSDGLKLDNFDEYCDHMLSNGKWGGNLEIAAMAD